MRLTWRRWFCRWWWFKVAMLWHQAVVPPFFSSVSRCFFFFLFSFICFILFCFGFSSVLLSLSSLCLFYFVLLASSLFFYLPPILSSMFVFIVFLFVPLLSPPFPSSVSSSKIVPFIPLSITSPVFPSHRLLRGVFIGAGGVGATLPL